MARTYSGNPTTSARDEIRFLTADTDFTKSWSLLDAEIDYAVTLYSANPPVIGQNLAAAAVCAETILANLKSAPLGAKRVGDLSISTSPATITFYEAAAYRLRQRANLQAVIPFAGGLSISEKQAQNADPDRVQPAFQVDGMTKVSTTGDPTNGLGF